MTNDDLGTALAGFALCFTAVIMSPHYQTTEEALEALANELHSLAKRMEGHGDKDSPALQSLAIAANVLIASEASR